MAGRLELGEQVSNSRVRVSLSVEHETSDSSSSDEKNGSGNDQRDSPCGEERDDVDGSLLITVGEVVVTSVHEVERSSSVHLENSSVEVLRSSVELSAVLNIFFGVSSVVSVGGEELSSSEAVGLIEGGELNSSRGGLDEDL